MKKLKCLMLFGSLGMRRGKVHSRNHGDATFAKFEPSLVPGNNVTAKYRCMAVSLLSLLIGGGVVCRKVIKSGDPSIYEKF